MEVVLDNKSYHIPEEWISRWELLSNYREDTGSTEMPIPSSAQITKKQMDKWIGLNKKMDKWLSVVEIIKMVDTTEEPNQHGEDGRDVDSFNKVDLIIINRVVQYFMPSSNSYLILCDFSSFPRSDRMRFLRELGSWTRSECVTHQYKRYEILTSRDAYVGLSRTLTNDTLGREEVELIEPLVEMSKRIPIDILYGLIASSSSFKNREYFIGGDWRNMLWKDAYNAHLLLQPEWEEACVAILRYYLQHREQLDEAIEEVSKNVHKVLSPPVLTPSNEVRIFSDNKLIPTIYRDPRVILLSASDGSLLDPDSDDLELTLAVRRIAEQRVCPDLLDYGWVSTTSHNPGIETDHDIVVHVYSTETTLDSIVRDGYMNKLKPHTPIPDTTAFFNRIYEYVERHPSWLTYDVLFGDLLKYTLYDINTRLNREESMKPFFNIISITKDSEYIPYNDEVFEEYDQKHVEVEAKKCSTAIRYTFGTKCLLAIATCIVGAMEKESLTAYLVKSPLNKYIYGAEVIELAVEDSILFLTQFAQEAMDQIEQQGTSRGMTHGVTDEIRWPVVYRDTEARWFLRIEQECL